MASLELVTMYINKSQVNDVTPFNMSSVEIASAVPQWIYQISSAYLLFISMFGIILNGSVIFFFWKSKALWSPFNLVVLNLIVNEFLVAICGVPVDLLSALSYGENMSPFKCNLTGFGHTAAGMVGIFSLTTLALSRSFLISCQRISCSGFLSQNPREPKSSLLIWSTLVTIWTLSLLIALPPLLGWGSYVQDASKLSCGPNWSNNRDLGYSLFMFVVGFFGPVAIIVPSNFSVICTMKRNTASKTNPNLRSIAERRERGATRILLLMTVAFFTCWMPYALMCLFVMAGGNLAPVWHVFPILFAKSSVCWNPFLYIFCNDEFQRVIRAHFSEPVQTTVAMVEFSPSGQQQRCSYCHNTSDSHSPHPSTMSSKRPLREAQSLGSVPGRKISFSSSQLSTRGGDLGFQV